MSVKFGPSNAAPIALASRVTLLMGFVTRYASASPANCFRRSDIAVEPVLFFGLLASTSARTLSPSFDGSKPIRSRSLVRILPACACEATGSPV